MNGLRLVLPCRGWDDDLQRGTQIRVAEHHRSVFLLKPVKVTVCMGLYLLGENMSSCFYHTMEIVSTLLHQNGWLKLENKSKI